jgi:lipopolysaccharide biosynthesis protein
MSGPKLIAFYLPQFHPIPENDVWWGKGFTEWTNVASAEPAFPGHYQPRLPADLGFYDLRVPEILREQAALARCHGLYGFCIYYYWFNGRPLLDRPLRQLVSTPDLDLPFCICWANENWTRRWDGADQEILLRQEYKDGWAEAFISDLLPVLADPRYIRVDGAPLLLVYRVNDLPDPLAASECWRRLCAGKGFPRLHLSMVQAFGLTDPRPYGFDSAVEFPPHTIVAHEITDEIPHLKQVFSGRIYDYREVAQAALAKRTPQYKWFRGVMTSWDNTPRRGVNGPSIYHHSSPREYEIWLRAVIELAEQASGGEESFIFINAWNEWAEGAYLEPDRRYGRAYLEATRRATQRRSHWRNVIRSIRSAPSRLPADVM